MDFCIFGFSLKTGSSIMSIESKEFYPMLENLVDILEAINVLSLNFQGKNINRINDNDAINTFVAKLELGILKLKKQMQFPFQN